MFLSFLPKIMKRLNVKVPGFSPMLLALILIPNGLSGQKSGALPNHSAFSMVLEHVVKKPLVDYAALKADRHGLDAYLQAMAETDPGALAAAAPSAPLGLLDQRVQRLHAPAGHRPLSDTEEHKPSGPGHERDHEPARELGVADPRRVQARALHDRRRGSLPGPDRARDHPAHGRPQDSLCRELCSHELPAAPDLGTYG